LGPIGLRQGSSLIIKGQNAHGHFNPCRPLHGLEMSGTTHPMAIPYPRRAKTWNFVMFMLES